ncbi:MAG: ogt [Mycobacterium sp.]|nr:ogt [Mycobacterium sp.]
MKAVAPPTTSTVHTTTVDSPVGPLTLTSIDGRLTGLHMVDQAHAPAERDHWVQQPGLFHDAVAQLQAYFAGELRTFDLPLDMLGTPFQRRVWEALRTIPYGETWSYAELARAVGSPGASRAVGLANGRNPVGIIVPCHRVIGANGSLTGYGGGLPRKAWLLDHERAALWAG